MSSKSDHWDSKAGCWFVTSLVNAAYELSQLNENDSFCGEGWCITSLFCLRWSYFGFVAWIYSQSTFGFIDQNMPIYQKNQIIMVRYMPGFIKRATTLAGFCMAQEIAKVIMRNCPQTSIYAQCIQSIFKLHIVAIHSCNVLPSSAEGAYNTVLNCWAFLPPL